MQVGMPGRDQRDPKGVRHPKTQDPHIAWPGDVYQMRVKRPHLRRYPILVAAQKGVAGQIVVHRKCRRTAFDLHLRERWLTNDLGSRPAMDTQERKLPAIGKGGELPAERSYSVGLAEAIGEESDAKWRNQQVVPQAKSAGTLFPTSGTSLRLQTVAGILARFVPIRRVTGKAQAPHRSRCSCRRRCRRNRHLWHSVRVAAQKTEVLERRMRAESHLAGDAQPLEEWFESHAFSG